MPERSRDEYIRLRRSYEPKNISLIIVAESPPASGKYFYDPTGAKTEPLFAAMMKQLGLPLASKEEGLKVFQRRGWVLVDATYEPVNALSARMRDAVILRDYLTLREDLVAMAPDKLTPLILLKANVCSLLEPLLRQDGFNVLNSGRLVYFPSNGRQKQFETQFAEILQSLS